MDIYSVISRKRDGGKLSADEIKYFVQSFTNGKIADYQASALLMAMFINGLDEEETVCLTMEMRDSGDIMDLSVISGIKVDKHSTGGVGDKTTLIVGPLAATCGVRVAKMSGRSLGFTGGTIDKLEAIPGFKTSLTEESFKNQVKDIGIAVTGQTEHIAPADKKIYALRDVTATVDNISLITSSIMSKKLASGSDAIVLDVKTGSGALMQETADAEKLADMMIRIGTSAGKKTAAIISDMSQPLGNAVGNSLEVIEAIETLKGKGPKDITELSVTVAGMMIWASGLADNKEAGMVMAKDALESGEGLEKFRQFVKAQGGNESVTDDYDLFGKAVYKEALPADKDGYIESLDARTVGIASRHAGAGRAVKNDKIDLKAGVILHKKIGDRVVKGDTLAEIFSSDKNKCRRALKETETAFRITPELKTEPKLIHKIITHQK